jgi:hypothetical protein
MRNPIAFHAEMMGGIMYYHQALQQPDAHQFAKAIVKEVNGLVESNHWQLIKRKDVPEDAQVVPSVWSMRRKRNFTTNEITKHKARLNLHGGKQVYGMNYYETYTPVVTWFAIRLMIVMGILFCWALCQVNFVMAYPQAPIETDIYIELPQGVNCNWKLQGPRAQATEEHLRSEAGRSSVEFIPCGQAHIIGLHLFIDR